MQCFLLALWALHCVHRYICGSKHGVTNVSPLRGWKRSSLFVARCSWIYCHAELVEASLFNLLWDPSTSLGMTKPYLPFCFFVMLSLSKHLFVPIILYSFLLFFRQSLFALLFLLRCNAFSLLFGKWIACIAVHTEVSFSYKCSAPTGLDMLFVVRESLFVVRECHVIYSVKHCITLFNSVLLVFDKFPRLLSCLALAKHLVLHLRERNPSLSAGWQPSHEPSNSMYHRVTQCNTLLNRGYDFSFTNYEQRTTNNVHSLVGA